MSDIPAVHPAEEFIAAYNQLDQAIRKRTGVFDRNTSFVSVFNRLVNELRWLDRHRDRVRLISDLRNVISHGTMAARRYLATPEPSAIDYVRDLHQSITQPQTVDPQFRRPGGVSVVRAEDSIMVVLELVRKHDFTHVPVVGETGVEGIITATGVLRWLGAAVGTESLIEVADVSVRHVLDAEDPSVETFRTIGRLTPVPEALFMFKESPVLQALLITNSGSKDETPLGIITTWDAVEGLGNADGLGPELDGYGGHA
jgi:predicted transcriptional regulator